MNERIKEFTKQMQWEEMGADLYGKSMDGCMTIHALEKFTELIVKECVILMKKEKDTYSSIHTDPCYYKTEAFGEAIDVLQHHFGVK